MIKRILLLLIILANVNVFSMNNGLSKFYQRSEDSDTESESVEQSDSASAWSTPTRPAMSQMPTSTNATPITHVKRIIDEVGPVDPQEGPDDYQVRQLSEAAEIIKGTHTTPRKRRAQVAAQIAQMAAAQLFNAEQPLSPSEHAALAKRAEKSSEQVNLFQQIRALQSSSCPIIFPQGPFVNVEHLCGDLRGGHLFINKENYRECVIEPTQNIKHIAPLKNISTGVEYGIYQKDQTAKPKDSSIFPYNFTEQKAIDVALRALQHKIAQYNNYRVGLDPETKLYLEMIMQAKGEVIHSAYPIFSYIVLDQYHNDEMIDLIPTEDPIKISKEYVKKLAVQALTTSLENLKYIVTDTAQAGTSAAACHTVTSATAFARTTPTLIIEIAPVVAYKFLKHGVYIEVSFDELQSMLDESIKKQIQQKIKKQSKHGQRTQ